MKRRNGGARRFALLLAAACGLGAWCARAELPPCYVGAGGGLLLPGNGNSLSRAADVALRAGVYATDFLAWEVEGACAPNVSARGGHEALTGVSARGLYHFAGFEVFDKLFGCERFDPFMTLGACTRFGARHAFADGSHRTATGPEVGLGAFYHLTENLDLRVDATALVACDSPCGMLYAVGVGLQWNFGGFGE